MCVDCVLASSRITQVDPGDGPLSEVVLSQWGAMRLMGVSLRYMMEFRARPTEQTLLRTAQFLHKELPIRIMPRALGLNSLPFGLSTKPAILKLAYPLCLPSSSSLPLVSWSGLDPPHCWSP
jgi:hypothetical protein